MLGFEETFKLDTIVARVIAKDISSEFRAIRINRGENSGIKKDMAVLTHEGIVGRVLRTSANTADVVTILDLLSAVDAVSERTRARGIVEGLTDQTCQLKYANRTDDIQIGDLVVSSGIGGIFPKGLTIGKVSSVKKQSFGITQSVEVIPAVDFSKLEEITLIDPPDLPLGEEPLK
jgi:rod shape-determining protein MreC